MSIKRLIVFSAILASLFVGYHTSFIKLHNLRDNLPAENRRAEALLVSPELLEISSGEFNSLLADYLLLKASLFIGGAYETYPEDWQAVYYLFNQAQYLDPFFFQTCYYTQAFLVWRDGLKKKSIKIVESIAEHRTWDWEPIFFAGFDYFYHLEDYATSAKLFKKAAKFKNAPPIVGSLGARIARKGNKTIDAINLLNIMYNQIDDNAYKKILKQRIDAYKGIIILEHAIEKYKKAYNINPDSLDMLVEKKMIPKLPENPFGKNKYYYDHSNGMVTFDGHQIK